MKIGDGVKKVTDALGIPQCGACKERQRKLNELGDWLSSFGKDKIVAVETIEVKPPVIDEVK